MEKIVENYLDYNQGIIIVKTLEYLTGEIRKK